MGVEEGNVFFSIKSETPIFELKMQGNSKSGRREENRLKQSEKSEESRVCSKNCWSIVVQLIN